MSLYELVSMIRSLERMDKNKKAAPMDDAAYDRMKDRMRDMMPGEVKF